MVGVFFTIVISPGRSQVNQQSVHMFRYFNMPNWTVLHGWIYQYYNVTVNHHNICY